MGQANSLGRKINPDTRLVAATAIPKNSKEPEFINGIDHFEFILIVEKCFDGLCSGHVAKSTRGAKNENFFLRRSLGRMIFYTLRVEKKRD